MIRHIDGYWWQVDSLKHGFFAAVGKGSPYKPKDKGYDVLEGVYGLNTSAEAFKAKNRLLEKYRISNDTSRMY